jgi:hypothetical protein
MNLSKIISLINMTENVLAELHAEKAKASKPASSPKPAKVPKKTSPKKG